MVLWGYRTPLRRLDGGQRVATSKPTAGSRPGGTGRRIGAAAICLALAGVLSAGCGGGGGSTGKTLTIADFDPFSGGNATYGFTEEAGCTPAVNVINQAGGVLGKKLR